MCTPRRGPGAAMAAVRRYLVAQGFGLTEEARRRRVGSDGVERSTADREARRWSETGTRRPFNWSARVRVGYTRWRMVQALEIHRPCPTDVRLSNVRT